MSIEERVENLERSNRRYRLAFVVLVCGALALALFGFKRAVEPQPLVGSSLQIMDAEGNSVVRIEPIGERCGRITVMNNSPSCGLHLLDDAVLRCRANLQTLANAATALMVRERATFDQLLQRGLTVYSFEPDLVSPPICTEGGSYSFEKGTKALRIVCSNVRHGSFDMGVDVG